MIHQLDQIIAQEKAVEFLQSALRENRLPHAMIFAGPAGVGKKTTAEALAAIILCQGAGSPETRLANTIKPCGKCDSCRLMAAGNHPDFHSVYRQLVRLEKTDSKARELAADVIRHFLIDLANLRASMGHGKIFVVEEAELMNASAQNTLLKTLEEPPGDTFIILLTDQPGALLPTIRSRCQVVPFGPMDQKTLLSELKKRGIEDSENAAFFAEGSLGRAIQWSQQGIIARSKELQKLMEQLVSGRNAPSLPDWLRKAADAYAEAGLKLDSHASKDQLTHDGLAIYLRLASLILRQNLKNESDADRLERLSQCIEALAEAEINLESNVNVNLALMNWSMAMERELVG